METLTARDILGTYVENYESLQGGLPDKAVVPDCDNFAIALASRRGEAFAERARSQNIATRYCVSRVSEGITIIAEFYSAAGSDPERGPLSRHSVFLPYSPSSDRTITIEYDQGHDDENPRTRILQDSEANAIAFDMHIIINQS